jgi:hypothetical protein
VSNRGGKPEQLLSPPRLLNMEILISPENQVVVCWRDNYNFQVVAKCPNYASAWNIMMSLREAHAEFQFEEKDFANPENPKDISIEERNRQNTLERYDKWVTTVP